MIALKEKISHLEHKNRRLKTELRDVEALQVELVTAEHEVEELRTVCDTRRTELARALTKARNQEVKYNKRSAELVAAQQVIEEKDKQVSILFLSSNSFAQMRPLGSSIWPTRNYGLWVNRASESNNQDRPHT